MDSTPRRAATQAAAIYLPLALLAAAAFAIAATIQGRVGPAAIVAGAVWVGLLTLIVLMPLVIPAVRRRGRTISGGSA
ncbi:MAG: hypothetical protein IT307_16300 [Chloroflexi bacterium]|nr:hypothetical protein [Chloroflexota bacterium]